MDRDNHLEISLLAMRLAMAAFLLIWTAQKLLVPAGAAGIYKNFYGAEVSSSFVMALGAAQLLIVLAFAAGVQKFWTYGAVLAMNAVTLLVSIPRLIAPYNGPSTLFWASVPVLAASLALFLLRDRDRMASIGN
jgi:putative oxidoreductase